jgi:hypothetical protein
MSDFGFKAGLKVVRIAAIAGMAVSVWASIADAGEGTPYYRFWRGWKRPELTADGFYGDISRIFVPATVKNGAGKGLVAYLPVFPAREKPAVLPDEIALVAYRDAESYQRIGATPEGQAYTASHWNYFDRTVSSSRVPEAFAGSLVADHAYDLIGKPVDWQAGDSVISIYLRSSAGTGTGEFLDQARQSVAKAAAEANRSGSGYNSVLVLAANDYLIVYQNARATAPVLKLDFSGAALFQSFRVIKQKFGETQLKPGSGINVLFDSAS